MVRPRVRHHPLPHIYLCWMPLAYRWGIHVEYTELYTHTGAAHSIWNPNGTQMNGDLTHGNYEERYL